MKRLFFLILGSVLLCSSALGANNSQPGKKAKKVGMLTAYYAAETIELNYREYQKGQLIWESNDPNNRIVEADEANYKYVVSVGCEVDCDYKLPKSKVYTKTYEMNELTAENVGYKAVYKSEDGLTARIFLFDFNGHYCRSFDGEKVLEDVTEKLGESYVLSFQTKEPSTGDVYLFEDFVEQENGILRLYAKDSSTEKAVCGYIEDLWVNASGWEAPSAFDKDGLMLTDLWQNIDMAEQAPVAYIAELDALHICGRLYYRMQQ